MSFDGLDTGETCIGDLPKRLSGIHIGDVNLHSGNGYRFQGIQNGNGGVGVGSGVDDDAANLTKGLLDLIHKDTFVIGLKLLDLNVFRCGSFLQQL